MDFRVYDRRGDQSSILAIVLPTRSYRALQCGRWLRRVRGLRRESVAQRRCCLYCARVSVATELWAPFEPCPQAQSPTPAATAISGCFTADPPFGLVGRGHPGDSPIQTSHIPMEPQVCHYGCESRLAMRSASRKIDRGAEPSALLFAITNTARSAMSASMTAVAICSRDVASSSTS